MSEPVEYTKENTTSRNGKIIKIGIAGLFVAAVGLGTNLYFIQNNRIPDEENSENLPTPTPDFTLTPEKVLEKYGIVCKKYTDINVALQAPETACELDLSNKGLTEIPDEIYALKNLHSIDLSKNKLTEFPSRLLELEELVSIDLSDNLLASLPESGVQRKPSLEKPVYPLQRLLLKGNPLSSDEISNNEIIPN